MTERNTNTSSCEAASMCYRVRRHSKWVWMGQLTAVFLRNVPPTPASYTQRAGRGGRRREGTAFALTYARATPHDQTHFFRPADIVQGEVTVPRINLANKKLTQRHINLYLLGEFLRSGEAGVTGDSITVAEFFLEP